MFRVAEGAFGYTIKDGSEWTLLNFKSYQPDHPLKFTPEQRLIDPINHQLTSQASEIKLSELGEGSEAMLLRYARTGFYAFNKKGHTLIVHKKHVTEVSKPD